MNARAIILFSLVTACHRTPATPMPPPTMGPTLGSTHAPEANAVNDEGSVPVETEPAPPPAQAQALLAATNALHIERPATDHRHVVGAIAALADALAPIAPPSSSADVQRIRAISEQLETGHERSPSHSDIVGDALDAAVRVLAIAQPASTDDAERVRAAMIALTQATSALDRDAPLLDQYTVIRAAFRAATLAVYAIAGASEPYVEPPVPVAWR
ncbi:MAG: hypothetical protein AB7O24_32530 [Kofleriaceae bacterium]